MNRLISTNLQSVAPDKLPPAERTDRVRMLFISTAFLGFRNYFEQLIHYTEQDEQVDAVHVRLDFPLWAKVLGKSIPVLSHRGWDMQAYRYLWMYRAVIGRWLRGPLALERFDVVHLTTETVAWSVVDLRPNTRTKFAVNIDATSVQRIGHFGLSARATRPVIAAERQMFDAADLIVCRNRWASTSLREDFRLAERKILVARNSLHLPSHHRAQHPPRQAGERVRLVFVGNDFGRKGGYELIKLHQQRFADRAELHICSARAKPDHSARNVVWHGPVPREKIIAEVLPSMDVFVMPTRHDMHPWAILEAAAAGLPVVTSRLAGIPEMVRHGESGYLCAVDDWQAVEAGLGSLIDDAELRDRMGRAGREHVGQAYNPDRQFGGLVERLKQLADE